MERLQIRKFAGKWTYFGET